MHFHTIGNRCWCGYLTVPNRFHERDQRGNVIGHKGPERYLAWLASDEKPDFVNPPVMEEINRTESTNRTVRTEKEAPVGAGRPPQEPLNSAGGGRGKGRPKKWANEAERLKAYRERRAK